MLARTFTILAAFLLVGAIAAAALAPTGMTLARGLAVASGYIEPWLRTHSPGWLQNWVEIPMLSAPAVAAACGARRRVCRRRGVGDAGRRVAGAAAAQLGQFAARSGRAAAGPEAASNCSQARNLDAFAAGLGCKASRRLSQEGARQTAAVFGCARPLRRTCAAGPHAVGPASPAAGSASGVHLCTAASPAAFNAYKPRDTRVNQPYTSPQQDFRRTGERRCQVARTQRSRPQRGGAGQRFLAVSRHHRDRPRAAGGGVALPRRMFGQHGPAAAQVRARLPGLGFGQHLRLAASGMHRQQPEAEHPAQRERAPVTVPSAPGRAHRQPNLVRDRRALHPLQDKVQGEAELEFGDDQQRPVRVRQVRADCHHVAALYLPLGRVAARRKEALDGGIERRLRFHEPAQQGVAPLADGPLRPGPRTWPRLACKWNGRSGAGCRQGIRRCQEADQVRLKADDRVRSDGHHVPPRPIIEGAGAVQRAVVADLRAEQHRAERRRHP